MTPRDDQKRGLVLELFARDVQAGLDAAVAEKRQELVRYLEWLWDKYAVSLRELKSGRNTTVQKLEQRFKILGYANKLGFITGLLTNGYLIDRKTADMLAKLNVKEVEITLNASALLFIMVYSVVEVVV